MESGLMQPNSTHTFIATSGDDLLRLDKFLLKQLPAYSRSYLQDLIQAGLVQVNGTPQKKSSLPIKENDQVTITFPPTRTLDPEKVATQTNGISMIYEHPHFLALSKPAGLTVHRGHSKSTEISLVDFLTQNYEDITSVGYADRPGIVHRLDKDTSGIILIARTNYAHGVLGKKFHDREMHKTYHAIVQGHPPRSGTIDLAIGRDPHAPVKMRTFSEHEISINAPKMRDALSHYRVLEYFKDAALVEIKPVTGRTHQIRVHLAAIGHPIIGDAIYGTPSKLISRQALHAQSIAFEFDGESFEIRQDLPDDMQRLVRELRK